MALLFADPCGLIYSSTTQAQQGLWSLMSGTIHTSGLPSGAVGSTAVTLGVNSGLISVPAARSTVFFGMRFYNQSVYNSTQEICRFRDPSTTVQVTFNTLSGGLINAVCSGVTIGTSSGPTVLLANTWQYLEFLVTIGSGGTGNVQARINGTTVLNANGTTQAGQTTIQSIGMGSNLANYIQDVYVCDTTGSHNTTFLGDVHVSAYNPTSNGSYTQYSANGAAQLYQCVNAATPTDSTVFASDSTPGDRISVNLASTSVTGTIAGVVNVGRMEKSDTGTRTAALTLTNGGHDSIGSSIALGTSYAYYLQVSETDPNTGVPWTTTGFNTIQTGVETLT